MVTQDGGARDPGIAATVGRDGDVVLTDPRAVRALAHPARLAVIDELFSGSVLTATECAAIAGLTPSAMSYHLRALEKWGVVVRADAAEDGRERPWRAAGRSLSLRPSGTAAAQRSFDALTGLSIAQLQTELSSWTTRRAPPEDPWSHAVTFSHEVARFTAEEATALGQEIAQVIDRHAQAAQAAAAAEPGVTEERRRVSVWHALTPAVAPGDPQAP